MAKPPKPRADELLVAQNLCPSRAMAQALIMEGRVLGPDGSPIDKPGRRLEPSARLEVAEGRRFASRGGRKLEGAIEDLGLDPLGLNCLDLGSSTGGFTDCLLQKGARRVTAVDVGRGLMDRRVASDPRVLLIEGQNARLLGGRPPEELGGPFDLAVMDLSFISLALVLPQAAGLLAPGGRILAMVKPQFEVGRSEVGKGGVVRDEALIARAVDRVSALGPTLSPPLAELGRAPSRLKGRDGNQEVFLLLG